MDRKIEREVLPWWRSRPTLIAFGIALVTLITWLWLPASGSVDIDASVIETGEVRRAVFDDYIPARATVIPAVTTLVGVMVDGQVESVLVQDGTLVSEGDALATLANTELQLQVLAQEAQITGQMGDLAGQSLGIARNRVERTAQVSEAEYSLIRAQRDFDIRKQLHDEGFVSDAGLKSYQVEVAYQQKRLEQLRSGRATESQIIQNQTRLLNAARERYENNLEAARAGLEALTIRAPMTGRLTNFSLQPGQTLKLGAPAGQVDSENVWKLVADIDEYYLGRVKLGQKALSENNARLTVSNVLPTVTNGRFRVDFIFDKEPQQSLNRGQTLNLRVTLGDAKPALVAPIGAWLSEGGGRAFVVDANGNNARVRQIKIGRRNQQYVEVLAGLKPGEHIITNSLPQAKGNIINIR